MASDGITRIGTTYGLARYARGHEHWAEQVYVEQIDDPVLVPHPDAGDPRFPDHLTPRTVRIRKGRGYSISTVLELTEQQAVEVAKLILDHFGGAEYVHPGARWDASVLRTKAKNLSDALNSIADSLEATG